MRAEGKLNKYSRVSYRMEIIASRETVYREYYVDNIRKAI